MQMDLQSLEPSTHLIYCVILLLSLFVVKTFYVCKTLAVQNAMHSGAFYATNYCVSFASLLGVLLKKKQLKKCALGVGEELGGKQIAQFCLTSLLDRIGKSNLD